MSDEYSPVPELNLLKAFQDGLGGRPFASGFDLFAYNDDVDCFWDRAPDAPPDRLIPFAYATSAGGFYALWRHDDRTDLATLPVVAFGDKGDLWIAARELRELLRLLAVESDDPEDRVRLAPGRRLYLAWLQRNFGHTPLGAADGADREALAEYTRRFAAWIAEFASEDLLDDVLSMLDVDMPMPTRRKGGGSPETTGFDPRTAGAGPE